MCGNNVYRLITLTCNKGIEWLLEHAISLLNHLFDNNSLCLESWCHRKRKEGGSETKSLERADKGYYHCKVADAKLFEAMKGKYEKYISRDF